MTTLRIPGIEADEADSERAPVKSDRAASARAVYQAGAQRRQEQRAAKEMDLLPSLTAPRIRGGQLVAIIESGMLVWADETKVNISDLLHTR